VCFRVALRFIIIIITSRNWRGQGCGGRGRTHVLHIRYDGDSSGAGGGNDHDDYTSNMMDWGIRRKEQKN